MKRISFLLLLLIISACKTGAAKMERIYALEDANQDRLYLLEIIRENQNTHKLGDRPMVVIDHQIVFHYCIRDYDGLHLKKSAIKSLKIIQATEAMKNYGVAAEFGLIEIETY